MKKIFKEKLFRQLYIPKVDDATIMSYAMTDHERFSRDNEKAEDINYVRMKHLTVNFIRHKVVKDYNKNCKIPSFKKEPELYVEWFTAINTEIARVYPFLKAECEFQIRAKKKSLEYRHPYG